MQAFAIDLSYILTINSKSSLTHTNIHLSICILSHIHSFMPSPFASISKTQTPLLLFQNITPELILTMFLTSRAGFFHYYFSSNMKPKEKYLHIVRSGQTFQKLSVQYYSKSKTLKQKIWKLSLSKWYTQRWKKNCEKLISFTECAVTGLASCC